MRFLIPKSKLCSVIKEKVDDNEILYSENFIVFYLDKKKIYILKHF